MNIYQVILKGYDSSTDDTDDHVLWVGARNVKDVENYYNNKYDEIHLIDVPENTIDIAISW